MRLRQGLALVVLAGLPSGASAAPWSVRVEALSLGRLESSQAISRGSFDGTPRLTSGDVGVGPAASLRLRVQRGRWSLEASTWRDAGRVAALSEEQELDPMFGPSGDYWTGGFDFAWRHELSRETTADRLAVGRDRTWRRGERSRWTWTARIVGARLTDEIVLLSDDAEPRIAEPGGGEPGGDGGQGGEPASGRYRIELSDRLLGLEGGLAWTRDLSPRWRFDLELGLGLAAGRATKSHVLENEGLPLSESRRSLSGSSWLTRADIGLEWSPGPRWSARLGAHAQGFHGVATAAALLPSRNSVAQFDRLARDGELVLTGLGLGACLRW